jgi:PTH1 family peptidyl-tRNA hydrolase
MISLILGLGNIGDRYQGTRHNLGFEVVKKVQHALKEPFQPTTDLYDWVKKEFDDRQLILAWPKTYMNRCGIAARSLLDAHGLTPGQMLVVVDDFNLPLGSIRIRPAGSDGGHNGLASLIEVLQTVDFPRLRLGIGPAPDNRDKEDFVLSRFEPDEAEQVKKMIDTAAEAVLFMLDHSFEEAMAKYNAKSPAQPEVT